MIAWLTRSVARRVAVLAALVAAVASTAVGLLLVELLIDSRAEGERRSLTMAALIGGAATVACVAVATVVIVDRLLSRRLRELTRAVQAAEKRQFLTRSGSHRPDEIGELSRSFDKLCATITDLSVAVIDTDRELAWTRGELKLKEALELLFQLSQAVSESTDPEALVREIPGKVGPALGLDEMAILLHDDRRDAFVVRAVHGIPEDVLGVEFSAADGVTGLVARSGEPMVLADTASDSRYLHYKGKHTRDGAFACVPMRLAGRMVGVFHALRPARAGFGDADVRLLASLASYTALALAHAEVNRRLRELSVTDELTGVANRRLLYERAEREVDRARRGNRPLSALMLDIDHFKRINDEHGHLRGDQVLRALGHTLAGMVRRIDTVARYGGEEFVVLLPDSEKSQAVAVAEKLRAAVAALDVEGTHLTISAGVATLPGDAVGDAMSLPQALIGAADRAMYAAKRAGRDRVVVYDTSLAS